MQHDVDNSSKARLIFVGFLPTFTGFCCEDISDRSVLVLLSGGDYVDITVGVPARVAN